MIYDYDTYERLRSSKGEIGAIQFFVGRWATDPDKMSFLTAIDYYRGSTSKINQRTFTIFNDLGNEVVDSNRANNQISADFFKIITIQKVSYLLGNGIGFEEEDEKVTAYLDEMIDDSFNAEITTAATQASLCGDCYIYIYFDATNKIKIKTFNRHECIPIYDIRNNILKALIRVYQIQTVDDINPNKIFVELYEEEGIKYYEGAEINNLKLINESGYAVKVTKFGDIEVIEHEKWASALPFLYLKNNEYLDSDFTRSLKNKIDLYDLVVSDFGNNLEDTNEIIWVLTNYTGTSLDNFISNLKRRKAIKVGEKGSAEAKTTQVPHEAREKLLDMITRLIYRDAMALNMENLGGAGALTNVYIKIQMDSLNLKTDNFEWEVRQPLIQLNKFIKDLTGQDIDPEYTFVRRTILNDEELIKQIYAMRGDISHKTAIQLNPLIPTNQKQQVLDDYEEEQGGTSGIEDEEEEVIIEEE